MLLGWNTPTKIKLIRELAFWLTSIHCTCWCKITKIDD